MALEKNELNALILEIKKASVDLASSELVFISEWVYDVPGQSLEIANQMLHSSYTIPTGWNGYGKTDLNEIEKIGFLVKLSENKEDPITLRKVIKFKINSNFIIESST